MVILLLLPVLSQPTLAQEFDHEPDRLIAAHERHKREQQRLLRGMNKNLRLKKSLDRQYAHLGAEKDRYHRDVSAANAYCRGRFKKAELRRREAICVKKQAALEQRLQSLQQRKTAIVEKRAEQQAFQQHNQAWLERQRRNVRSAVANESTRQQQILTAVASNKQPSTTAFPGNLTDLKPGDIILVKWEKSFSVSPLIPPADWLYRMSSYFASGVSQGLWTYSRTGELIKSLTAAAKVTPRQFVPISHAATVVKSVKGHLLILDHTGVGSRMLTQKDFQRLYGHRQLYAASPWAKADGQKLWRAARTAALQPGSDYGLLGERTVCSERAAIVVAGATGMPYDRGKLIDVTPGDFFDEKAIGKYFTVSRLGGKQSSEPSKP
jgi:hypothetical protein